MMGGALGLAVLASLAASRTQALAGSAADPLVALNGGYHAAFLAGAAFAAAAAVVSAVRLREHPAAEVSPPDGRPERSPDGPWR